MSGFSVGDRVLVPGVVEQTGGRVPVPGVADGGDHLLAGVRTAIACGSTMPTCARTPVGGT